jgi:hypothetical protein
MVLNQTTVLAWIIHTALIVKCLKVKYTTLKGTALNFGTSRHAFGVYRIDIQNDPVPHSYNTVSWHIYSMIK